MTREFFCFGCGITYKAERPEADFPYGNFCSYQCHDWAWAVIWLFKTIHGKSPRQAFEEQAA